MEKKSGLPRPLIVSRTDGGKTFQQKTPEELSNLTLDGFLNKQIWLHQPRKGYRVAIDPVFLAASLPLQNNQTILDMGCGVGSIGCFLLFRNSTLNITGVEKNDTILNLASHNYAHNGFSHAFRPMNANIKTFTSEDTFDHVVSNPPFFSSSSYQKSPSPLKCEAHEESLRLDEWLFHMMRSLKQGGTFTIILPPARLKDCLSALTCLGNLVLFPLWQKEGQHASRLLIQGIKGNKSPLMLKSGLVLHELDGAYTQKADAILKGAALKLNEEQIRM